MTVSASNVWSAEATDGASSDRVVFFLHSLLRVYSAVQCGLLPADTQFKWFLRPYHYVIGSIAAQLWSAPGYHADVPPSAHRTVSGVISLWENSPPLSLVMWEIYTNRTSLYFRGKMNFPPKAHGCFFLTDFLEKDFNWKGESQEESNH